MINQFKGNGDTPAQFTRGYGLAFGRSERKAMSMSMVDRALRAEEFGERIVAPAQDEEFVISHSDNVQATGFVEHLKLPHYVDFQAELGLVRRLRAEFQLRADEKPEPVLTDPTRSCGGGTHVSTALDGYNIGYLDEQTKRMIRRALLKAVAIPGFQVPFASARCPCRAGGAPAACR